MPSNYEIQHEKEAKLIELGTAGKLSSIEILIHYQGKDLRHQLTNQTAAEIIKFREIVFSIGIMLPSDPGTWYVVPPWNIKEITITKQSKYFRP